VVATVRGGSDRLKWLHPFEVVATVRGGGDGKGVWNGFVSCTAADMLMLCLGLQYVLADQHTNTLWQAAALEKLSLNDSSVSVKREVSPALGLVKAPPATPHTRVDLDFGGVGLCLSVIQ
jgi:hypothetical protein